MTQPDSSPRSDHDRFPLSHSISSRWRNAFGRSANSRCAMRAARCASAADAFGAGRRQARAPMRQRLMRLGEALQHFEVLALAEPAAQSLGFVGPHPAEARPQRLDQLHLIAHVDDALAQRVQFRGAGVRPVLRNAAGARCGRLSAELRCDRGKIERIERPLLDRGRRGIEPGDDGVAQLRRQHRLLLAAAQRLDAAADGPARSCREHQDALVDQAVEGIERRCAVARVRQRAGMVARLVPPARRIRNERFEQPHQRAPLLHGAAKVMHRVLVRKLGIGDARRAPRPGCGRQWRARPVRSPYFGRKAGLSPIPASMISVHDGFEGSP